MQMLMLEMLQPVQCHAKAVQKGYSVGGINNNNTNNQQQPTAVTKTLAILRLETSRTWTAEDEGGQRLRVDAAPDAPLRSKPSVHHASGFLIVCSQPREFSPKLRQQVQQ